MSLTRIRIVVLLLELARWLGFVASASFGIVAELDVRARPGSLFVALTGSCSWAWRGWPGAGCRMRDHSMPPKPERWLAW